MRTFSVDLAIALLLMFIALGLLAPCVGQSLWIDELHTSWTIHDGVAEIAPRARLGNNHPLYFYLVYGVVSLLGESEFSLRLPSILAGLFGVATAYWLVRRWTGFRSAGFVAAATLMIDPHFIFYSVEARSYALVQWIGMIQIAAFLAWCGPASRHQSRHRAGAQAGVQTEAWGFAMLWCATSTLMFYLHCTSFLLPLVQIPFALCFAGSAARRKQIGFASVVLLALISLGIPALWEIYSRKDAWESFIRMPAVWELFRIFSSAHLIPAAGVLLVWWFVGRQFEFQRDSDRTDEAGKSSESSDTIRELRQTKATQWRVAIMRILVLVVTYCAVLLLAFMLTRTDVVRLFMRRYMFVVSSVPMLIAGMCIGGIRSREWRYLAAILTLATAICVGPIRQYQKYDGLAKRRNEDWRSAAKLLNDIAKPGDVVYVASDLIETNRLHDEAESADDRFVSYCQLPFLGLYPLRGDLEIVALPIGRADEYIRANRHARPDWIASRWAGERSRNRVDLLIHSSEDIVNHSKQSPVVLEVVDPPG